MKLCQETPKILKAVFLIQIRNTVNSNEARSRQSSIPGFTDAHHPVHGASKMQTRNTDFYIVFFKTLSPDFCMINISKICIKSKQLFQLRFLQNFDFIVIQSVLASADRSTASSPASIFSGCFQTMQSKSQHFGAVLSDYAFNYGESSQRLPAACVSEYQLPGLNSWRTVTFNPANHHYVRADEVPHPTQDEQILKGNVSLILFSKK